MMTGAHVLLFSASPEADRAFFRDILQFPAVDAGHGWLIFALPPAELAVHPGNGDSAQPHAENSMLRAELYLMCDDLQASIRMLEGKGVRCAPITKERWGLLTTIRLPSGGEVGLYQPLHPTAIGLH